MRSTGKIKFFELDKGYGFITRDDGSPDVFLHRTDTRKAGIITPKKGMRVSFEIEASGKGPRAVNLSLFEKQSPETPCQ